MHADIHSSCHEINLPVGAIDNRHGISKIMMYVTMETHTTVKHASPL